MINNKIKVTSVVEDTSFRHGLWATHGISFLIESGGQKILFDAGESPEVLSHNLKVLKINPRQLDCLVISHGHVDHIGGLANFLPYLSTQPIYIPENALDDYSDSYFYEYSNLPLFTESYEPAKVKPKILAYKNLKKVGRPIEIYPNFWLTGLISKKGIKEQSLVIDSSKGSIIITGCSHPGIENIITTAQQITNNKKLYALIGGLHLKKSNKKEIEDVVSLLKNQNLKTIAPCHCTGYGAVQMIKNAFGKKVELSILGSFSVGDKIIL